MKTSPLAAHPKARPSARAASPCGRASAKRPSPFATLLALIALLIAPGTLPGLSSSAHAATFDLSTATIEDIQAAMNAGALSAEQLVSLYLARIDAYDRKGPRLNSIILVNTNALAEARALDQERKARGPRSPLHGIVVMPKDVFDTFDMPTSGGYLPMARSQPSRDAFVIDRLRKAGAIILAKLNQSDWYGVAASGGSTLQGQVLSPYNPRKYGGGSSSGTGAAMAAWLGTVGLGSDTSGSIVNPTAHGCLVGIAATQGLISRTGMMWSAPGQEKGGPMGRSVYDCAAVLDAIAGYDPADLMTESSIGRIPAAPYTSFIHPSGLVGARIGVLREMIREGAMHTEGLALTARALADMKNAGALLVDPALSGLNLIAVQQGAGEAAFTRAVAIDAYLARLPDTAPIRSVQEMITKGGSMVKPAIVETAAITDLDRNAAFIAMKKQQVMLRDALVELMDRHALDAIVLPYRTTTPAEFSSDPNARLSSGASDETRNSLHSFTGLPTILVPGGFFPSDGMPFSIQFLGRPYSEPTLIRIASGYESVTRHRKAPSLTPPLPGEVIEYNLVTSSR
ncbi:MAG: amidase [Verrucomicrobiae bacterium]|nr:amidase [Verrucomicrobiae bacterium]